MPVFNMKTVGDLPEQFKKASEEHAELVRLTNEVGKAGNRDAFYAAAEKAFAANEKMMAIWNEMQKHRLDL